MEPLPIEYTTNGPRPNQLNTRRRQSVAAEVNCNSALYVPRSDAICKTHAEQTVIREALGKCLLFQSLEDDQIEQIIQQMEPVCVKPNQLIIRQGDSGEFLYVIEKGHFVVYKDTQLTRKFEKNPVPLRKEEPNVIMFINDVHEYEALGKLVFKYENSGQFGELALMYHAPRAASVVAASDGQLWKLHRSVFRNIIVNSTRQRRMQFETFLASVPIFADLSSRERSLIADCLESQTFKQDDTIIKEGDTQDTTFYLLISGTCAARQQNKDHKDVVVGQMTEGSYFGERALITQEPRKATVVVVSKTARVAKMERAAFERLLGDVRQRMQRQIQGYRKADEM